MKLLLSFILLSFIFHNLSLGQVPLVDAAEGVAETDSDLSLGILEDPQELAPIEGLDEPLERLKLRDQDANMILDMIQLITGRYILRPQNLPQVKINFDSISVLSKRETLKLLKVCLR